MSSRFQKLKIGIDFGGVLSIHDRSHTTEAEHKSDEINMPDALNELEKIKSLGHELILISFCGKSRAIKTKESVMKTCSKLFDKIIFVKSKDFKVDVCKKYGCDVMIDDTLDILVQIHKFSDIPNLIWFTGDPSSKEGNTKLPRITEIDSWKEITRKIESFQTCLWKSGTKEDDSIDLTKKIYDV